MSFRSKTGPDSFQNKPVIFFVLFLLVLLCMENAAVQFPGRAGVIPVYAEEEAHESFTENILFLGDSMIYNPEYGAKVFSAHGHQVFAAMGATLPQFYGVTHKEVTIGMKGHYIKGTAAGREYNGIAILMGANDLANHDENKVFDQYQKLLRELQSANTVPIYVLQVFPVNQNYSRHYGNYKEKNRRASVLNEKLWQYCESVEGLYFVDATNGFMADDGQLLHDYGDGLHMDPAYYGMFYKDFITAISTLKDRIQRSIYDPDFSLEQYWICRLFQETMVKV